MSAVPLRHPVLEAIDLYRAQTIPDVRLKLLFPALEVLARIDALPLAARLLASGGSVDPKIRRYLLEENPSLGIWIGLLERVTSDRADPATAPLREWTKRNARALDALKALRNESVHAHYQGNAAWVADALGRTEALFEACLGDHPEHGVFARAADGTVTLTRQGLTLACDPFVLAGRETEALLIYDGRTSRRRSVQRFKFSSSSNERFECPVRCHQVDALLGVDRATPLEIVEAVDSPRLLRERSDDATANALDRLREARAYRPEVFVARAEADAQLARLLAGGPGLLLVEGPSGAGKTAWLSVVAERRLAVDAAVFLEAADRLDAQELPDALAAHLFFSGAMGPAFDCLDDQWSSDARVLVAIDGVGADGNEGAVLRALFRWVERLSPASPVRLVATIDSARWERFAARSPSLPAAGRFQHHRLRPLTSVELRELVGRLEASRLAAQEGAPENEGVRRARTQALAWLSEDEDALCRRPGLVIDLLEEVARGAVVADPSAARIYEAVWRRVASAGGKRLLLGLAGLLLERRARSVEITDQDALSRGLFGPPDEPSSTELLALVGDRALARSLDPYLPSVSFENQRFFEFVAALTYRNVPVGEALRELAGSAPSYPQAAAIAGHLVVQSLGRAGAEPAAARAAWEALAPLGAERDQFTRALAAVDRSAFLAVFPSFVAASPREARSLLVTLMYQDGRPMLAARAAETFLDGAGAGGHVDAARLLRAQAFYEVDDYALAEAELHALSPDHLAEASQLRGDIAEARGNLDEACAAYQAIIDAAATESGRRLAEMKLGYALGRRGLLAEGEWCLRNVLARAEGDDKTLAEAWGALGQICVHAGRFDEAERCLRESMSMNRRMGLLVGVGVVEGLYGELAVAQERWQEAETRLRAARAVHETVENRWRLWWTLERLIPVLEALGRPSETPPLRAEADALARQMGLARI